MTSEKPVKKSDAVVPVTHRVEPISIEQEMKTSFINYAMSVIISRAIPDVRDGLKPVHRRCLYGMWDMGNTSDKPTKKSARVVGDVMGKYHPHGDASIYDTIVKMAQPFSYRHMLVEGQGNFGSIDGDSAAASRYTEVRLDKYAEALLEDLDKDTVKFQPNYDESLEEPTVLPAKIPNLLVNGTDGIAVGMATKMPPHNLTEVCEAVELYLNNPEVPVDDLMRVMKGPDFPTGGILMGVQGVKDYYTTGHGRVIVRGVAAIEESDSGNRGDRIIVTELPYQVNKAQWISGIADMVKDKKIDGISDIRDESDKEGIRVVFELRKGTMAPVILNNLYKNTALESGFSVSNIVIVDNQPKLVNLHALLGHFVQHRIEIIRRRSEFDLKKAQEKVHILEGLLIALAKIDAVIKAIRASDTVDTAKAALITQFGLDEPQANAILQMQLRRLAALEQKKINDEKKDLGTEIARLEKILSSEANIKDEIRRETREVAARFGDKRRTQIEHDATDLSTEDLIEDKNVLVSITTANYIKRIDLDAYRRQRRGGHGVTGMTTKEEDLVDSVFVAGMKDYLLCFTNLGRVYWLKVYEIPESSRIAKGKPIVNLLNLRDEIITTVIPVSGFAPDKFLLFATKLGQTIKIPLDQFSNPRSTGTNAIRLREGDRLVDVILTNGNSELILTSRFGQSLRFHEETIRTVGRNAQGVRGMKLRKDDTVVAVTLLEKDHLLTISDVGFGKRSEFDEFRGHGRGTLGVRNMLLERDAVVIDSRAVSDSDEIIVMTASGIVIRTPVSEFRIIGRGTKGVKVMRLDENDKVVGIAIVPADMANGNNGNDAEPDAKNGA
ncbi:MULTISPECIES: DNA gyrase subunit A [unclassified Methanoregula]|uniref:DNA gyrase subunit A n=1 Tax=unclassified Methanoregula TaxID=2649730 RepID=UPI0009C580F1|nr:MULTISPECIES: DNA gyrase subunit A [unclassified Methanoregula]OPX62817.1 MAG: DNA gyrase subunit A [Methanoregula sp. PtaB.Bin085]OPY35254.1 MAG: DNA gyrase subunit A [Methanoregula sp. PtaU1.Bin006]